MTTSPQPLIYVACLASYNEGHPHGAWIEATQDIAAMREQIAEMLHASPSRSAEEWAIHEVLGFGAWRGAEDLDTIAEVMALYEKHGAAVFAYAANNCGELANFEKAYCGEYGSEREFAVELADDAFNIPESMEPYFDYEAYTRDLFIGDYWSAQVQGGGVYVFANL